MYVESLLLVYTYVFAILLVALYNMFIVFIYPVTFFLFSIIYHVFGEQGGI